MIDAHMRRMRWSLIVLGVALFAPALDAQRWRGIGPAAIQDYASGRVSAVAVHPSDPSTWLIGAALGGIWRTLDGGSTWAPLTDDQPTLAMGAIAFAPSNPVVVYAGTGDRVNSVGTYAGGGLLKSLDGGTTWQLLAAGTFAGSAFTDILVDPADPDVLIATTSQGAWGLDPWLRPLTVPPRGIFKSSDGGVNWTQKGPTTAATPWEFPIGDGTDLAANPQDFKHMYAGIGSQVAGATNGLYRSLDAGETWTLLDGPFGKAEWAGRIALAIAPSDPNVLYVSAADAFGDGIGHDGGLLGLWRTDDAWSDAPTWIQIPTSATDGTLPGYGYCGNMCWFTLELSGDPADANTLYAAGVAFWKCTSCGAAPTWTDVTGGHHDQHNMAWAGNRLIMGNDGGIYSTTTGGSSWTNHNEGLSITQFWSGCLHPYNPSIALSGTQDNGMPKWSGSPIWQGTAASGDWGGCAFSTSNPDSVWGMSFARTLTGGASSEQASTGVDFYQPQVFIMPLEQCPADEDVFIAANSTVWKTVNFLSAATPTWSANSNHADEYEISALAFAPSDQTCNTYASGTLTGDHIRRTAVGGEPWDEIGIGVPDRYVTDLAFDPIDANALYVTLAGFDENTPGAPGHVFKTSNALDAAPVWTNISTPSNLPHNTIAIDPVHPNVLYVGTDQGVWKSTTGGSAWVHHGPDQGMPNVPVYDLKFNAVTHRVVAFTHGRGAFALIQANVSSRKGDDPDPVLAGQALTYTVGAGNEGPDHAESVQLVDVLPPGVTFVSATTPQGSCSHAGGTVTCQLGSLPVASSVVVTIGVTPTMPGSITNTATVSAATEDPDPTNDIATAVTTVLGGVPVQLQWNSWLRNPDSWPVDSLTLGGITYLKRDLLALLAMPPGSQGGADASVLLARQLIAAKLNMLNMANGCHPVTAADPIATADELLRRLDRTLPTDTRPSSPVGREMVRLAAALADHVCVTPSTR